MESRYEVRRFPARKGREFSVFDKRMDYVLASFPTAQAAEKRAVEAEREHREAALQAEQAEQAAQDEAEWRRTVALLAS